MVRFVILAGSSVAAGLDDLEVRVKQEGRGGLISSHESFHFDSLGLNAGTDYCFYSNSCTYIHFKTLIHTNI